MAIRTALLQLLSLEVLGSRSTDLHKGLVPDRASIQQAAACGLPTAALRLLFPSRRAMAIRAALFLLPSLAVLGFRSTDLHKGLAQGGLPCELELTTKLYGAEWGVLIKAYCTEDVTDAVLLEPRFSSGLEPLPLGVGNLKGGVWTKLNGGNARYMEDPGYGTMVGQAYVLRGKTSDGTEAEVSATVPDPTKKVEKEEKEDGDAPCILKKEDVTLVGDKQGFKLMLTCEKAVDAAVLNFPKGYAPKTFAEVRADTNYKLAGPFSTEGMSGKDFVLRAVVGTDLARSSPSGSPSDRHASVCSSAADIPASGTMTLP
eukprot:CAMPEP_0175571970 /NCGR_PEP_ID=MMETSP0096-20121207/42775_1 /TAXON_ID=311494 /ORGANISM="Alexandrium monilatum, Strain CCMP3105" /LENGTH=314 /DNA_ID=CAMNT_0016875387 /DNA_START=71 /DNA_END=1012 /DNA_ORIENTATION=-